MEPLVGDWKQKKNEWWREKLGEVKRAKKIDILVKKIDSTAPSHTIFASMKKNQNGVDDDNQQKGVGIRPTVRIY